MFGYNTTTLPELTISGDDGTFTKFTPGSIQIVRNNDNIGWLAVHLALSSTDEEMLVFDASGNRLFRQYAEGGIRAFGSVTAFNHAPISVPPSITGSRAAMGVGTYELIQALSDIGYIIDNTSV